MKTLFDFFSGAVTTMVGIVTIIAIITESINETPLSVISAFIISCMLIHTGIMMVVYTYNKEMNGE